MTATLPTSVALPLILSSSEDRGHAVARARDLLVLGTASAGRKLEGWRALGLMTEADVASVMTWIRSQCNAYAIADDDGDINPHFGAFASEEEAAACLSRACRRPGFFRPQIVAVLAYLHGYTVAPAWSLIPPS